MKKYFAIILFSQLFNLGFAQSTPDQGVSDPTFIRSQSSLPVGTTISYCGNYTAKLKNEGWLLCNGESVDMKFYPALFEAIGEMWGNGGDGKYDPTTKLGGNFNLPDFRGEFLRGVSDTTLYDPDVKTRSAHYAGGNVKGQVGSYQSDEFKSHTHSFNSRVHQSGGGGLGTWTQTGSTETGAKGGAETRPKNAYVYFLIKAK